MISLYLLIIVIAIALWFLLVFAFKPIGKLVSSIWTHTKKTMNDIDEDEKKEKKEE